MDRGTTEAYQAALVAQRNKPVFLVSIAFDAPTGTVFICDSGRSIVYGGHTYLGVGHLLGVGDFEESAALGEQPLDLQLSGVGQTFLALLLQEHYLARPVTVQRAFLDEDGQVIADPADYFAGTADKPVVTEDPAAGTCTIALRVINGGNKGRRVGRCTNSSDQEFFFPGDRGFDFVPLMSQESIPWGKK